MVWTSKNGPKCPVSPEDRGEFMEPRDIRAATIEECARFLKESYPDHAAINAYCAAIRSLSLSRPNCQAQPVCQACKSPLAVTSIMGTAGLCSDCVPSGFEKASTLPSENSFGLDASGPLERVHAQHQPARGVEGPSLPSQQDQT